MRCAETPVEILDPVADAIAWCERAGFFDASALVSEDYDSTLRDYERRSVERSVADTRRLLEAAGA